MTKGKQNPTRMRIWKLEQKQSDHKSGLTDLLKKGVVVRF